MGRELRRKQAKKDGKSLIIITIVLVAIIGIIYLLSALFVTKELKWFEKDDEKEVVETVANTILAKEIFDQTEEEYYVYLYDFSDTDERITSTVSEKLTGSKVYNVNTGSALNSNYVSETSNKKAKKLSDLKVKSPTLIKISKDKITLYYEGNEILEKIK